MITLCEFIDEFIGVDGNGQAFHLEDHQRRILGEAFRCDEDERLVYRTIIYSAPKKSGKTSVNSLVSLWFGYCIESPNEIIIAANDLDQSISRVFNAAAGFIRKNLELYERTSDIQRLVIRLKNETEIKAVPSDYQGEAGGNQGLSSFDEIWAFLSEKSRRLYEELTPVPTRKNSIRFISTYAGWEGESTLLEELYQRIFDKQDNVKPGVNRPLGEDFPVYTIGDLFMYWDHEPRMPWQTPEYYESQRADLRVNTYLRLHENRWVSNESSLFDMEDWDRCVDPDHRPPLPDKKIRLFVACDASTKKDRSAIVSVYRSDSLICLGPFRTWQPTKEQPMDLELTMESYVLELDKGYTIVECRFDPWQLHRSATTLKKAGVKMVEFPQTVSNLTDIGQALFDLVHHGTLRIYEDDELRKEARFTIGKETSRGMMITKERGKTAHKIDAIVALAMAVGAASVCAEEKATPGTVSLGKTEGPYGEGYEDQPSPKRGEWFSPDIPEDEIEWMKKYE